MKQETMKWMLGAVVAAALLAGHAGAQTVVAPAGTYHLRLVSGGGAGVGQSAADDKDELFAGTKQFEKNASEVTEINMDPDTLNLVHGKDSPAARNTLLKVVRTYEYDKPGQYDVAAVDAIRNRLSTGDWRCPIHTRELKSGESTDVCYKHRSDGYEEKAIITVEPRELTFIHTIEKAHAGQGELSGLPMVFGDGDFPLVAQLDGPLMAAEMKAQMAEMQAMQPQLFGLQGEMSALRNVRPLSGKDLEELNKSLKGLKINPQIKIMPHIEVIPDEAPEPPAKPEE